MSRHERADLLLVRRGFFESRKRAQDAIAAGLVMADGAVLHRASAPLRADAVLCAAPPHPWVSRGGVKLEAALAAFGFDPNGKTCLDVGASTGGFTDVLLARGAARVYAVDVGHGQLHERLQGDPRVISLQGTDARSLKRADFDAPPELIACDVSFISLKLVLPNVPPLAAAKASLVCLVKPQFEVGRGALVKGIVKNEGAQAAACAGIEACIRGLGWAIVGTIVSPIAGGDGNREFLIGARRE